jgi:hypothetical protein
MKKIDTMGDIILMKVFIGCCKDGTFIDYDGYGHPIVNGKEKLNICIKPSEVKKNPEIYIKYKKISWYNR